MSRRATLVSATLLASAVGAGLAAVAPSAVAATSTPTVTAGSRLGAGAVTWPLTVTGTGLTATTKVTFTKTGTLTAAGAADTDVVQDTTKTATVNAAGTSLTVIVNVVAKATTGAIDIVVTNTDGGTATCYPGGLAAGSTSDPGCLTIDAAPTKLVFTQNVGVGATKHTTPFTATGLLAPPMGAVAPYLPQLLSAASTQTFTATTAIAKDADAGENASITVPTNQVANATSPVILVNGDGGRETDGTLNITAPPMVANVAPASGDAGHDFTISVAGTFDPTPAPTVTFLGTTVTSTKFNGSGFTADLGTVPASTPNAMYPYTVTNGDGGTVAKLLTVVGAPAAPAVMMPSNVGDGTATISFSPVPDTSNGGAPISSYTVTTTPDTGPHSVNPMGQALSYTLTGLADGTSYTALVTATNTDSATGFSQTGAGTMSSAFTPMGAVKAPPTATPLPAPVAPAAVPSVSLKSSLKTIKFASPVTISGTATLSGAPIVNMLVDLQTISSKGARDDTGDTTRTDSAGHFTFAKVYPSVSTNFGVGIGTATTAGIRVVVTQYLLLTKKTLAPTRAYTITGLGTPGTTDKKAKVVLFKVTKSGHRVGTITSAFLAKGKSAKGYSSGISTFMLKSTLKRGNYLVAVAVLGTSTNGPVQTKPFTIKVP